MELERQVAGSRVASWRFDLSERGTTPTLLDSGPCLPG
ncbi:uncharacterized protein PgNI_12156 [Pyricularia grisea]|uniref:Uncharacterized protein n=1 Tax=Pyricularia grisea TaxID=148305 RepID=A0A6P8AQA3_PYRGI|nr:uncharacterized protein PgNI_12156 [Pyricularia grisea]TLD04231.1 hypothetical protein PgNI_12156 [Pyricularia grisea]